MTEPAELTALQSARTLVSALLTGDDDVYVGILAELAADPPLLRQTLSLMAGLTVGMVQRAARAENTDPLEFWRASIERSRFPR